MAPITKNSQFNTTIWFALVILWAIVWLVNYANAIEYRITDNAKSITSMEWKIDEIYDYIITNK